VYYHFMTREEEPIPVRATTDARGRFAFTLTRADVPLSADTVGADPLRDGHVVVKAEGFTIAWARAARSEADFAFRVRHAGAPREGGILDVEGRPIAGLRVRVLSVAAPARGDLSDFLKALEGREALYGAFKHLPRRLENRFSGRDVSALLPSAT